MEVAVCLGHFPAVGKVNQHNMFKDTFLVLLQFRGSKMFQKRFCSR